VASGLAPLAAEEAVAEAFARAWASWPRVRGLDQPRAWVVRVAVNADVSWWRRRRREVVFPDLPDSPVEVPSDTSDLIAAIRSLPARQREVVVLRYLLDLDTSTTARWLGIAPGTVTAHLHHALAALRAGLTMKELSR
jgi:RNA polymerase sigma-70 factor (ECF subfamily)